MKLEKLAPIFCVADVPAAQRIYERVGFHAVYAVPDYALMKREGAELHLAERDSAPQTAFLRPSDIDAFHAELAALALPPEGWPSLTAPRNAPFGMREFSLTDPDGNVIRASQEIPL
ncbi:MAG: VOC family protein [Pseudomonadota bacterium]